MYKIKALNKISEVGLDVFNEGYRLVEDLSEADAVIVRSASMLELELPNKLLAIARAGAGVNNIPIERCSNKGIVVFNTPGANANAVKELVILALLLSSRDVIGGINWVKENSNCDKLLNLVEKEKSRFAGREIQSKKLGVIGLGAIGVLVANAAKRLGMEVYGYDPYLSVENAWNLMDKVHSTKSIDEIYKNCDYISLHLPLVEETNELINKESLKLFKNGAVLLNFSRDKLVNELDIKEALDSKKLSYYVTDFPTNTLVNIENVISIPHLGASTVESEDNCAVMAVKELRDYIENGSIKNSVNFPNCELGRLSTRSRILILHKNIPSMLTKFTALLSKYDINIEELINKSRGEYAYSVFDIDKKVGPEIKVEIEEIKDVMRVRIISKED